MKHFVCILITLLATYTGSVLSHAADIKATARLDSAYILMGKQTALHVEVVGELNEKGSLGVIDTMWRDIEIIDMGQPVVTDLGNRRKELKQDIIIQAFDSGMYALPPVFFMQPGDTAVTDSPVLKVVPVPVDTMLTVHDYADVVTIKRKITDYLPDWATDYGVWILLALIVIGVALYIYFKWIRKGKLPKVLKSKPIPPFKLAMQQLSQLRSENLCERGEEKKYYTLLTDILRNYLYGRFGINAMEMTSAQIVNALRHNPDTKDSEQIMQRILEIADFVKFAKVRPLPDDNKLAMDNAVRFLEETKPVEPAPGQNTNNDKANQKS